MKFTSQIAQRALLLVMFVVEREKGFIGAVVHNIPNASADKASYLMAIIPLYQGVVLYHLFQLSSFGVLEDRQDGALLKIFVLS